MCWGPLVSTLLRAPKMGNTPCLRPTSLEPLLYCMLLFSSNKPCHCFFLLNRRKSDWLVNDQGLFSNRQKKYRLKDKLTCLTHKWIESTKLFWSWHETKDVLLLTCATCCSKQVRAGSVFFCWFFFLVFFFIIIFLLLFYNCTFKMVSTFRFRCQCFDRVHISSLVLI